MAVVETIDLAEVAPAVIVRDRSDIATAVGFGWPVTLLSPPGFALYCVAPWWMALLDQANFRGFSLLDCADAPGRALEALYLGLPGIVLAAEPVAAERVTAVAAQYGALMFDRPPPALDLSLPSAKSRLRDWLRGDVRGNLG